MRRSRLINDVQSSNQKPLGYDHSYQNQETNQPEQDLSNLSVPVNNNSGFLVDEINDNTNKISQQSSKEQVANYIPVAEVSIKP